jgi:hypothetical protein
MPGQSRIDAPGASAKITIVIPHYQTLDLIKLCLRSIRKHTPQPYQVIVVDNDSKDASLEYLHSVKWIHLIQRNGELKKMGSWAHGSALDIGLEATGTEFFLALHSDVIVKDGSWLKVLTAPFQNNSRLACAGSGKLEAVSAGYRLFKKVGNVKGLYRFLVRSFGNGTTSPDECHPEYIRTICALYRTSILKKEHLSFLPIEEKGMTSGQALYYDLIEKGYLSLFHSPDALREVIEHLNHGTMVLNPSLGARKRTIHKGLKMIRRKFREGNVINLLEDSSLDC